MRIYCVVWTVKSFPRQVIAARSELEASVTKQPPPPSDSSLQRQPTPRENRPQTLQHVIPKVIDLLS